MNNALFANVSLFQGMDFETLQRISSAAVTQSHPKNKIIVQQGQMSDVLYVIVTGQVRVYVSDESGKELTLCLLGAGEYFGEHSLIDGAPGSATVVTTQDSVFLKISQRQFSKCIEGTPAVAINILKGLVRRIRDSNDNICDFVFLDVYGRVGQTLLKLAKETDEGLVVSGLTQQEIATMVGASREMVSRVMMNLRTDGYITVANKYIKIVSPPPTSN